MNNGSYRLPEPSNEPILDYAPGSPERAEIRAKLKELAGLKLDIPLVIGGKEVRTKDMGEAADICYKALQGIFPKKPNG
jgi:1-pyrroline-5-carboxylate dehydrogenase